MPIKRSAYKEIRKSKKRHQRNITTVSELKTLRKKFERFLVSKKLEDAKATLKIFTSKIDKAAAKGVIKKNAASRSISRLMKRLSKVK